jgi:hypothetical protein
MTTALKTLLQNGQLENNGWIFNAEDYNLPKNGKLTFRFKCNTCNLINEETSLDHQSNKKEKYEPTRIYQKYTPYVPEFPTSYRNADIIPILPGNSQSTIERDSYGVSSESAQYPNMITGVGKRDLIQRLTPSSVNYLPYSETEVFSMYNLDNLLANIKESELTGDSPMSAVTNVFDRKYPQMSIPSKFAHIDPEYLPNGLFNDAQGINNLLQSSKGWGKVSDNDWSDKNSDLNEDSYNLGINNSNNIKDRRPMFSDGEIGRNE